MWPSDHWAQITDPPTCLARSSHSRVPALSHANENPLHGLQMFPTNISLLTKDKAEKPVHGQHPLRGD